MVGLLWFLVVATPASRSSRSVEDIRFGSILAAAPKPRRRRRNYRRSIQLTVLRGATQGALTHDFGHVFDAPDLERAGLGAGMLRHQVDGVIHVPRFEH